MPQTPSAPRQPATLSRRRRGRIAAGGQAGATLTEAAVATAIAAVLLGSVVPGFNELRDRKRVEAVAAQLETDIQLARSEAVARQESVRIGFTAGADGGSCYVLHTGPAHACGCDSAGATTCAGGAQAMRSVPLAAGYPVQLRSNSRSILFDAVKGTVTPTATMRVTAQVGEIRQVVNIMGRVRSCTPNGLPGYKAC